MIENMSKTRLIEPRVFTTSGKVNKYLPYTIDAGSKAELLFQKTPYVLGGAEGVVVYTLENTTQHLCMFYCVPFIGHNSFFLKWENSNIVDATKDLRNKMAIERWTIKGELKWQFLNTDDDQFSCKGFMTQSDKAEMVVDVLNHEKAK